MKVESIKRDDIGERDRRYERDRRDERVGDTEMGRIALRDARLASLVLHHPPRHHKGAEGG